MPNIPNPRTPSNKRAERRFWKEEAIAFRKKDRAAFVQSRIADNISKAVSPSRKAFLKRKIIANAAWENLLESLSLEPNPKRFLRMLRTAFSCSESELRAEKNFLETRSQLFEITGVIDFDAEQRQIDTEYRLKELRAQSNFFGIAEELKKKRLLGKFGKLIFALSHGKDAQYNHLVEQASFFAGSFFQKSKESNGFIKRLRARFRAGKISKKDFFIRSLAEQLMISQQRLNLSESQEMLFSYLFRAAKETDLRIFLRQFALEARQRKTSLTIETAWLEREIEKTK